MKFEDEVIKNINIKDVYGVSKMIIEHLCGEKYYKEPSEDDRKLLEALLFEANKNGLGYEQFNELLLLLDQDRVSEDFFKFFFEKKKITLEELKQGVIKFRGYAMLCFGNYRFAYKKLIQKNEEELKEDLKNYWKEDGGIKERPTKSLEITDIERNKTWFAGYISTRKFKKENVLINRLIESKKDIKEKEKILKELRKRFEDEDAEKAYERYLELAEKYKTEYLAIQNEIDKVEEMALKNSDIYLTWDYMDVYVATSMRHKWEFEETFDFIEDIFKKDKFDDDSPNPLTNLNLRYFDPTQSLCRNRIDKGLIEGLVLKRALCTIYVAQESDTMGKDSELAATLAQGKPVIAYVPRKDDIDKYSPQIKGYPLDFFEKRLLILQTEEVFSDESLIERLDKAGPDWRKIIDNYIEKFNEHRSMQPFTLIEQEESEFKSNFNEFDKLCRILAIAESYNFDKRAKTLCHLKLKSALLIFGFLWTI